MLNTPLYGSLLKRFGEVRVVNENEEMTARYGIDAVTGRSKFQVETMGEAYQVCCPFCADTRFRLWINHRWASLDARTMERPMYLAKCFNEDCIAERGWRQLEQYVFNKANVCLKIESGITELVAAKEAVVPGPVRVLSDLDYGHHASVYLRQRGFDIQELSETFKIGYCGTVTNRLYTKATNRIIIPAYLEGVLVGWQARYIGERDWHDKEFYVPKYFSMPGFRKSHTLYNIDEAAKDSKFVVLCEGPSDVWRIGPSAVAMFGKSLSHKQAELIGKYWHDGYVIVMLDRDAIADTAKTAMQLQGRVKRVFVVAPPKGFDDPGDAPRFVLWQHIGTEVSNELVSRIHDS